MPFGHAQVLRWSFVAIGGIGLAFYLYRELLARYFVPWYDYQVAEVRRAGAGLTEIALAPLGRPATFTPGQFAMLYLEAIDGWHRHPFTITSAPGDPCYPSPSRRWAMTPPSSPVPSRRACPR